jgi:RNA polymerase sigma-70 factor (ECF subfamily)
VFDPQTLREVGWIIRAQTGDHAAFLSLVGSYERKILFFIRRFERDPTEALDALQEVWLTAWKSIGKLRKPEAFRVWIYRIAHDVVVTGIRSEHRRREVESGRISPQPESYGNEDTSVESAEMIQYALAKLSPEHREVVTLRFLEDMTIDEIAEAVGAPAGTIKSRLHYAKAAMLTIIEEQAHASE